MTMVVTITETMVVITLLAAVVFHPVVAIALVD
jgi:hypothetical protein